MGTEITRSADVYVPQLIERSWKSLLTIQYSNELGFVPGRAFALNHRGEDLEKIRDERSSHELEREFGRRSICLSM